MSDTEKLIEAIERAIPKMPGYLRHQVEELLTPANIILFVGLTVALMASGVGEVIGLGLLVVGASAGGLDLCFVVLRQLAEFYHKATQAQTERDLDQAADLFVAAVVRGGVDVLDILIGRRAAAKLAGRGLRSVGEYLAYLEEEMKLWRGRSAGGGRPQPATASQEVAPAASAQAPAARKPGKLVAGTPEHKAQRWKDYKRAGGPWSYERWSKQYDTNMRNVTHGLSREGAYRQRMGGVSETIKTPYTNRQIDISIRDKGYLGQLKTGKVSLTEQAKIDIRKDADLVKQGYEVEYILEKGASKPFLKALDDAGIGYKIGSQIPEQP